MASTSQLLLDAIEVSGLWLSQPFQNFKKAIGNYNPDMSTATYHELVSIIQDMKKKLDPQDELNKNSTDAQKNTVMFPAISSMSDKEQSTSVKEACQFCSLALFKNTTSITVDNNFHTILNSAFYITVENNQGYTEVIWGINRPDIPGTITYITEYGIAPNDVSIEFDAIDTWYFLTSEDLPILPDAENGLYTYTFVGWREEGTDSILTEGSQINDNTNHIVTLEAVWQQTNTQLINTRGLRHFAQQVSEGIQAREKLSNKVTSLSASSTDIQYPSAKAVYDMVSALNHLNLSVVQVKPTENIQFNTIYLVPAENAGTNNIYEEWVYINNSWELIGSTAVDLTNYAPKASPTLTGVPTAPTATAGTNTTQIATTAFVQNALADIETLLAQI